MRIMPLVLTSLTLIAASQAIAHAHFNPPSVAPGYAGAMAIQIGHGCHGQPTEGVTLYVPDQVTVAPVSKTGWQVSSTEVSGRVTELTWFGNSLPSNQKDEFAFEIVAPTSTGAVAMAVKQTCANAELFWQDAVPNSATPMPSFNVGVDAIADVVEAHDHDHDHDHEGHDHDDHHGHAH